MANDASPAPGGPDTGQQSADGSFMRREVILSRPLHEQVDVARRILAHFAPNEVVAAYLSGSNLAGLANIKSDIDLYVITRRDDFCFDGQNRSGRIFTVPFSPRIDIKVIPQHCLEAMLNELADFDVVLEDLQSQVSTLRGTLRDVCRLLIAMPIHGAKELQAWIEGVPRESLRRYYLVHFAAAMLGPLEDTAGAVESGDLATGLLCSHSAVVTACETVLAAANDLYPSSKHVLARLWRHDDLREIARDITRLLHAGIDSRSHPEDVERLVHERIAYSTELASSAMLLAWDGSAPVVVPRPALPSGGGPRRNPYCTLLRTVDGFAVAGATEVRLEHNAGAQLWLATDGTPIEDLVEAMSARVPLDRQPDVKRFVETTVAAFESGGILATSVA